MTNTNKMTKRDYFSILREAYPATADNYEDVIAFIDHELELLAKKNAANKKPTAAQGANEGIKANILAHLATRPSVASEIAVAVGVSTQKASALCKLIVNEGKVTVADVKVKNKGTVKQYTLVSNDEGEGE